MLPTISPSLVARPAYDAILDAYTMSPEIKVLSGVRRCGKSTLLFMLARRLLEQGVSTENIFYKKLDAFDVPLSPTAEWLESTLLEALAKRNEDQLFFVFLDEVQEVAGWEKVLRRLHTERCASIYLTGSNAFLLSSDLATYLSGRYVQISVMPLSFKEYLSFAQADKENLPYTQELFARYVRFGGMPGLFETNDFSQPFVTRELSAIKDTVILNDVAKRFELRDVDLLEKLLRYVYSTSGNLFSARKIAGALTSAGKKTSQPTVEAYLSALEKAYLLESCEQIGIGGKQIFQPQRKLYAPDTGLRNLEIGFSARDLGFQLENVVYCELRRRGYKVFIGDGKTGEVDFVAERMNERLYIQVSDSILDEHTRRRELSSLEAIADSFPKMVLTRDALSWGTTESGIRIVSLLDWLLDSEA